MKSSVAFPDLEGLWLYLLFWCPGRSWWVKVRFISFGFKTKSDSGDLLIILNSCFHLTFGLWIFLSINYPLKHLKISFNNFSSLFSCFFFFRQFVGFWATILLEMDFSTVSLSSYEPLYLWSNHIDMNMFKYISGKDFNVPVCSHRMMPIHSLVV